MLNLLVLSVIHVKGGRQVFENVENRVPYKPKYNALNKLDTSHILNQANTPIPEYGQVSTNEPRFLDRLKALNKAHNIYKKYGSGALTGHVFNKFVAPKVVSNSPNVHDMSYDYKRKRFSYSPNDRSSYSIQPDDNKGFLFNAEWRW
jgi:hypothetical protein